MSKRWKEFLLLNLGTLVVIVGVYFFKFPNHFSDGGVSGIAIVLGEVIPGTSPGMLMFVINMALLLVGFLFLGRSFGIKTVYSSVLISAGTWLLERLAPLSSPLTNQPLLELLFAVGLPAFGSALLFNMEASTGGTDILAMLFRKYGKIDNIGRALFVTDFFVTLSAAFVFGIQTGMFSFLGLIIKSLLIDMVIENINRHKYFNIICKNPQVICDFIMDTLHRGATVSRAQGAFSREERFVIYTLLSPSQAVRLRRFVKEKEPTAFLLITNTSEIIGKGFR